MIVRTLVVDDFENFRRFACSVLQQRGEFQITEASDGFEAIHKAEELQPDLILLDIGLPDVNGLEVAKRVSKLAPAAKILFLSQESSPDVIQEALGLGAGYVHKPRCQTDLLPAIEAVLRSQQCVDGGLPFGTDAQPFHRHEILFCSDDDALLDGLTRFLADALNSGNPAIVWATKSHQASLLQRLRAQGVDIDAAVQRGTYISTDADEPFDPAWMLEAFRGLSAAASKAGKKHPRIAACGEHSGRLWAAGKTDEAIRDEQFGNELVKSNDIDILCVYPMPQSQDATSSLKSICAAHSVVSYR